MSVIKPRNKLISFRLADEEYKDLRALCQTQGARSISELARLAMFNLLANGVNVSLEGRLNALDCKVTVLDRAVQRLAQLVGAPKIHE